MLPGEPLSTYEKPCSWAGMSLPFLRVWVRRESGDAPVPRGAGHWLLAFCCVWEVRVVASPALPGAWLLTHPAPHGPWCWEPRASGANSPKAKLCSRQELGFQGVCTGV